MNYSQRGSQGKRKTRVIRFSIVTAQFVSQCLDDEFHHYSTVVNRVLRRGRCVGDGKLLYSL